MSEVPSHGRKSLFTAIWMGRYWQQDQFRSSFAPPNGREISFGVVRLVDLRLNALYLVRKPTLKEKAPPRLGLQRSNQSFLLLRNSFGCQRVRKNYSETRLVANRTVETTPKLVSLSVGTTSSTPNSFRCQASCVALTRAFRCLFCRLVAWGRSGGTVSRFCLSQQVPEPTLSTGVSATVVNMLSNKLRVCVVLGICVLWRRPSRAAMDAAHSQPREMRSPACGYRLLGQTNCRQSVDCH